MAKTRTRDQRHMASEVKCVPGGKTGDHSLELILCAVHREQRLSQKLKTTRFVYVHVRCRRTNFGQQVSSEEGDSAIRKSLALWHLHRLPARRMSFSASIQTGILQDSVRSS